MHLVRQFHFGVLIMGNKKEGVEVSLFIVSTILSIILTSLSFSIYSSIHLMSYLF